MLALLILFLTTDSSNLSRISNDELLLIIRHIPDGDRSAVFRFVNKQFDVVYRELNGPVIGGLHLFKSLLHRLSKQLSMGFVSTDNSARYVFLGKIHQKYRFNEHYALTFPLLLDEWGRTIIALDHINSTRIVKTAKAVSTKIGWNSTPPAPTAWRAIDDATKCLIVISHQMALPMILAVGSHEMQCLSLLYSFLWDHIVFQNKTILPALDSVYDLSENQQIPRKAKQLKYLEFLIDGGGLFVIHRHHLSSEWKVGDINDIGKYVRFLLDITERFLVDAYEDGTVLHLFAAQWVIKLLHSVTVREWILFLSSGSIEANLLKHDVISTMTRSLFWNEHNDEIWRHLLLQLKAKYSLDLLEYAQHSLATASRRTNSTRRYMHFFGTFYDVALGSEGTGTGRRLALSTHLWFTGDKQGAEDILNTFSDPQWNNELRIAGVELPFNVRRVSQQSQGSHTLQHQDG